MKKLVTTIAVASMVASASMAAPISFGDNFDGGLQSSWQPKWTADQPGLWGANASDGTTMSGLAKSQYRVVNQQAFSIDTGETATISSDFRFEFSGDGAINFNKNFMGFLLTTDANWWAGQNKTASIVNRGGALGSGLGVAPWVEGWFTMESIGQVNTGVTNGVASMSSWFDLTWNLRADGSGNIFGSHTLDNGAGTTWTSTEADLGIANGTTVFAGYSSGYQDTGTNILSGIAISEVQMDNFQVDVIPEPGTLGLIGATGIVALLIRRRFMI